MTVLEDVYYVARACARVNVEHSILEGGVDLRLGHYR